MKKKRKTMMDILAAVKAMQRECEITEHGKPISISHVVKSKKVYTRKTKHKNKKDEL